MSLQQLTLPLDQPSGYATDPDELATQIGATPMTGEPILTEIEKAMDPNDDFVRERVHYAVMESRVDARALKDIRRLARRYPEVASMRNLLSNALLARGKKMEAKRVREELLEEFPDYLPVRLAAVDEALKKLSDDVAPDSESLKRFERMITDVLGNELSLSACFPERSTFHFTEIRNFYAVVAQFHICCGRIAAAEAIREALIPVTDFGDPVLKQLTIAIIRRQTHDFEKVMEADLEREILVQAEFTDRADPNQTDPPELHHPEIRELYYEDLEISREMLNSILALPRESLIEDLSSVLDDSFRRKAYFLDIFGDDSENDSEETLWAPLHAIFLLGELGATEKLGNIIDFLSQSDEARDLWIGNLVSPHLVTPLHQLLREELDAAKAWMLRPAMPREVRTDIMEAVAAIGRLETDRYDEIVTWFDEILVQFLEVDPEANILDTRLVTRMVGQLIDLQATQTLPLIEQLLEKGYVELAMFGEMTDIRREIAKPPPELNVVRGRPLADTYRWIMDSINGIRARAEKMIDNNRENSHVPILEKGPFDLPEPRVPHRSSTKPGRNAPCPCGSGKKFKKCCGP